MKEITNWSPGSYYKLSFEYMTYDEPFRIRVIEQSEELGETVYNIVLDEALRSSDWTTYTKVLSPSNNTRPRLLQIVKDTEQSNSEEAIRTEKKTGKVDFRKLALLQIPHPQILLVKDENIQRQIPHITFTRINPTKYRIHVKNARDPYTLVFLEAFSPNWKLYPVINASEISTAGPITDTYFDGFVTEGAHINSFYDTNTFETRNYSPLDNKNHFQLNGYANGWSIDPAMVDNQAEYDFILEMSTQQLLYPTLLVSIVSLCIVIILYGIELYRKVFFEK